uniref:Phosphoethanolamine transferase n=1 Tax=Moraxella sp. MSG47-C17 TaxID=1935434 RepID=A0A220T317_9GAMM|nr:phosphoethanolamine--lipid A transferase MCR-6.1 [Moraxella sp. MSG47-C17]ASK49942.1 phosphoethanolamine transferase [Moraxella sp. MSG47-C17]BCG50371.1 lipid A phosphoethanolamine transferase MCR-6 [Expression vector pUC57-Kan-mcr-6]
MTQHSPWYRRPVNPYLLMSVVALFLSATANLTFFDKITNTYPMAQNAGFVISTALVLFGAMLLITVLLSYRYVLKPVLILLLIMGAVTSYFTDTYGTVYDTTMLQNALQTDQAESKDLMNMAFFVRIIGLGVLPSILVAWVKVDYPTLGKSLIQRAMTWGVAVVMALVPILAFSSHYASFFREHKPLRSYVNPVMPIYSVGKLASIEYKKATAPKDTIYHAKDAVQTTTPAERKPRLVVFVVGETARADHVQFNGYSRETFPQLAKIDNLANFSQVTSCGTSTAYSVPCMFSYLGQDDYDVDTAKYQENVLDTLDRLGVGILWRDNNSDSKGVMDKLPASQYFDYKSATNNTICNTNPYNECRDVGMLVGLDDYVSTNQGKDMLIMLHQMGNHGPAYFKRYDEQFAKYTPVCEGNELAKCEHQSLINAYDNALLATDDFIAKSIDWLKTHQANYDVAMLYVSDHGESLGENGVYLHGMPNAFAPKEQRAVPAFFWSNNPSFTPTASDTVLTHDAITPTLLKLFDVTADKVKDRTAFIR